MKSFETDKAYLKWIKKQLEWQCVITGNPEADACHLVSKGASGSDYWVFPLIHELHMIMDHGLRGSTWNVKEHRLRVELSYWYYSLPSIHKRYFDESPDSKKEELLLSKTFGSYGHDFSRAVGRLEGDAAPSEEDDKRKPFDDSSV